MEKLLSKPIEFFHCDGVLELTQGQMGQILSASTITYWISCQYIPQQNGLVEHKNHHISEVARSLLPQAHLPYQYWYDVYATASFLINRLPSPMLNNKSPFELLFHSPLYYYVLRDFRCLCYPFLSHNWPHKLSSKSIACIFLGYTSIYQGYICFDPHTQENYV